MTHQQWLNDKIATLRECVAIEFDLVGLERTSGLTDELCDLRQRCVAVKRDILSQLAEPLDLGTIH